MDKLAASGSGTKKDAWELSTETKGETSEKEPGVRELNYQSLPPGGHKSEVKGREDDKENLFEKCLTAEDVTKRKCLIPINNDAENFSQFLVKLGGTSRCLPFEDENGKPWKIKCSYYSKKGYLFTSGWRFYVRSKQLRAGDFVFFQQHRMDSSRLFIGCRRYDDSNAAPKKQHYVLPDQTLSTSHLTDYGFPSLSSGSDLTFESTYEFSSRASDYFDLDPTLQSTYDFPSLGSSCFDQLPTSLATDFFLFNDAFPGNYGYVDPVPTPPFASAKKLELAETLKEVETPLQLKLPEHSITGFDPVLVIFCDDNQESEETYFISYIVNELCLRGFSPLRYDLTKNTVTGNQEMLYRVRVGIVIFSINYIRSSQYMDEFVAIKDHLKANNLITVFFKTSDTNINDASGSFEKAFSQLAKSAPGFQIRQWRAAMKMIKLFSSKTYQYMKGEEVILAKNIVRDVCRINSETNKTLKGVGLQLQSIASLLNCSQSSSPHIVGLWGMAGIGKTTIAREIFQRQALRYDMHYFLQDFHLMCQTKGLSHLRDEFFVKVFGEEQGFIDTSDTKLSFTRDRFRDKRVLIVLDGVSNAKDAEILVGGFGWFSGGHTIILTSRNRQILVQCNAREIYQIPVLSEPESFRLCRQYEERWTERVSLISELVNYAGGNPLALQALSLSIQKKCIDDEKQYLRRLHQHPPIEIQDAFRRSFDGLDDDEKNIFLDLACFFRGENKDHVVNILDGCSFHTDLGICGLIDESVISLVDNKIEMPNIFQVMGRFVVCQEYEEAGKRSRLWDSNDITDVLTKNKGTEAIEGIFLDVSGLTLELSPTVFERMYRLRLFKLHGLTSDKYYKVHLPQGLYSFPDELRLLHWERYPLVSLPRKFNPKNLVELNMPYSNLTKLWKGTKNLEKLKRITLSHSQQLLKFPRLSKARNLEHIDFEGCTSLVKVNSSILHHHKLTFLSLKDCSRLRIMPAMVHLESLEVLNLSGCSELEELKDFSPNLKELYLAGTAIRELPSSLEDLTRLVTLDLENCVRLEHLPPGIINLKAMLTLKLSGCSNLKRFPQRLNSNITTEEFMPFRLHSAIQESRADGSEILLNFGNMQRRPDIHGSRFSEDDEDDEIVPAFENWPQVTISLLPSSILHSLASRLYALVSLFLYDAYLVDIPEDLCWFALVKTLDLGGNAFSRIPKSIKELRKLHSLRLRHCKNLKSLPELPESLKFLNAHGCVSLESFPSGSDQFPRHYAFSNCFNLSPELVKEFIRKAQCSVEGMARGHQLGHSNMPSFSIFMPASSGWESLVNFHTGSSLRMWLTVGMLKTVVSFSLSVVVEFWDNYRNTAGFGIKCTCRKSKTDISPVQERIFYCWDPKEAPTVRKDHMFVFGCVNMITAVEEIDHSFLGDMVTFEFHPVDWEKKLLDDSCMVKKCGVYLITDAASDKTLSTKRRSSMDIGELSTVEHMAPPYKRGRFKRAVESVILRLKKRKREKGVYASVNERRQAERPEHAVFVGDLAPDVTDYMLTETFKSVYASVKGAKVVTDRTTGRSKGYGFVRFGDEGEQIRAMTEMNGQFCSSRPMRIGPAANKKPLTTQPPAAYQNSTGNPGESDPTNTTIFVGALDQSVTEDALKSVFGQFGELVHVNIPAGKRCGFVQYANRACAEQALSMLNGTQLGGQSIRLSWGVKRASEAPAAPAVTSDGPFWTVCRTCRTQYEYHRMYLNKNVLCPNCRKPFIAVETDPPGSGSIRKTFTSTSLALTDT